MTSQHVFISYGHEDLHFMRRLRDSLSLSDIKVWVDRDAILPGEDWRQRIADGLRAASTVLVIVGDRGVGTWQREEVGLALSLAEKSALRITPVLLPGSRLDTLPSELRERQRIDLRTAVGPDTQLCRIAASLLPAAAGHSADDEEVGDRLRDAGDLAGALEHYIRAHRLLEEEADSARGRVAIMLRKLGATRFDLGRFDEARQDFEQALKIDRENHFEFDECVARDLNNLASVLRQLGRFDEALPLLLESLEVARKAGEHDVELAGPLRNLGAVYRDIGSLSESRRYYEAALSALGRAYGDGHPEVASALTGLAGVLVEMGEIDNAREVQERALGLLESSYGNMHPDIATALHSLAQITMAAGDHARARVLLERALSLKVAVYGEEHPSTVASMHNLANIRASTGDLSGAADLFRRVLEFESHVYGTTEHPSIAVTALSLGTCLCNMGQEMEGLRLRQWALGTLHSSLGDHFERAIAAMGAGGAAVNVAFNLLNKQGKDPSVSILCDPARRPLGLAQVTLPSEPPIHDHGAVESRSPESIAERAAGTIGTMLPGSGLLFAKGLAWLARHLSANALMHAAAYVVTSSVMSVASTLSPNPISSVCIGGVIWTQSRIAKVNEIVRQLADGNAAGVVTLLLELLVDDNVGANLDETVDQVATLLEHHYDKDVSSQISGELRHIAAEVEMPPEA